MKNKKYATIAIIATIAIMLLLSACGRKQNENPANMDELYRTQGVPVRTQTIQLTEFKKEIEYNTRVSGIRETPVSAMVADKVQNIRARVGQNIAQNQIIIDFPDDNIAANYHQAKAAYDLAMQTWQRMQNLYETGGISQQDLDGAETQFKVAQANWNAVTQTVHARAPISGILTDINVRQGQNVAPGDYLFTISQISRLHGRIWVSENDINDINQTADVTFVWNDIEKKGKITNIALSLNRDQNGFAADIEIENADHAIRSGITGKVTVAIYKNENAIVIPRNIVQTDENGQQYVYIANQNTATRRNITIANESALDYEVRTGLQINDIVIVQGLQHITENSKLKIQN